MSLPVPAHRRGLRSAHTTWTTPSAPIAIEGEWELAVLVSETTSLVADDQSVADKEPGRAYASNNNKARQRAEAHEVKGGAFTRI